MTMKFFRDKRNSTFTIVVFGFIILTFIFWGSFESGGPSSTVLTQVNGEDISYSEFQRLSARQLEAYGQLFGQGQKINKNLENFVRRQVANMLISRKLMAQEAKKVGIIVGKDDILKELENVEAFQDPQLKRFSPRIYQLVLEQNGLRPADFEQSLKEEIAAKRYQQLLEQSSITSTMELNNKKELERAEFQLQTAKFSLSSPKIQKALTPKDDELKSFYESHKAEFLTPEKRVLEVARLDLESLSEKSAVTDVEIENYFNAQVKDSPDPRWTQNRARAIHLLISGQTKDSETRIRQIFNDLKNSGLKEDSKEFEKFFKEQIRLKSEDYATSFQGGDLGYFSAPDMVKAFSDATFGSKERKLVGPIKSDFGYHLIYVLDKTDSNKSLKNRRGEIAYTLQSEKTEQALNTLREETRERYVGKSGNQSDWLSQNGFVVTKTSPIDRSARDALIPFAVVQKAFDTEAMTWQEPEEFEDSLILVRSLEILSPEQMSFEDAKAQVTEKLREQKLADLVQQLYQELGTGKASWTSLAQVGAELRTEKSVRPFKLDKVPGFPQFDPLTRELYSLSEAKSLSAPILVENYWVLMKAENFKFASEEGSSDQSLRTELLTAKSTDVLDATLQKLIKEADIPKNFREEFGI